MKSISNKLSRSLYAAALLLALSTTAAMAQDDFPEDVNDEPTVPIDGFVIAGLLAGSILGIRKLYNSESQPSS